MIEYMTTDRAHALRQLIRSYALQIEYINLLLRYGQFDPNGAEIEIALIGDKMDCATERLCQLRLSQNLSRQEGEFAINPALIPDLQYN